MTLTRHDILTDGPGELLPPATGAGLREALDGPFHPLKQRWRDEVRADELVRDPSLGMDDARDWTLRRLIDLSRRRFVTAGFPESAGGTGDMAESVANFEMLGMGDLSLTIKSGVQHGLFGGAIVNLGTTWHHQTLLPEVVPCRLLGCFAMTELGHGSDVSSIETTITWLPESDEYEVSSPAPEARKVYIGNAARDGRMAVVFGQLAVDGRDQGVHAILVPIRDEQGNALAGVTIGDQGHKGGLLGVDNGTLWFDHVRVPRRMLLDRYGGVDPDGVYRSSIANPNARFFTMLGTLVRGRICVGGGAASATRRALSIATRYALTRTQFRMPGLGGEIPLLDYQTHQRKLLPEIARAYAYGFAQNELSAELQRVYDATVRGEVDPQRARALESRAAGMKAVLTRWANDTVQVCREACGGAGFLTENQLTLTRSDVDVFATFEGDNTVLLQLVAKALLIDYRKSWGEMDLRGTAQATARLVGGAFAERTASRTLITRLVETAHRTPEAELLTSRGWQVEMFEERERHSVESLGRRMRAAARLPKDDSFTAINATQSHMLFAARAHTEREVLEAFITGIDHCLDSAAAGVLSQMCDLYALHAIEADRAWFLEHNRLTPARAKAITAAVDDLCARLRPHALALIEGLGVPVDWLEAPLLED